jgi:hypothetical protein
MKRMRPLGAAILLFTGTLASASDWKLLSDRDGIQVYTKKIDGSDILAVKGHATIQAPLAKVVAAIRNSPRKVEWADRCAEARIIRQITRTERIEYTRGSAPWPVKDREFLVRADLEIDVASRTVTGKSTSVEDPEAPPNPKYVRGHVYYANFVAKPAAGGAATDLLIEIQSDLKGALPKWLVNYLQKMWPRKTIEGLRKQAAKADVEEDPIVKEAFSSSSSPSSAPSR